MVLIQRCPERRAGAGSLLTAGRADCSTIDEVIVIIRTVSVSPAAPYSPCHDSECTNDDRAADADDDTDDHLFRRLAQARVARVSGSAARVETWSAR